MTDSTKTTDSQEKINEKKAEGSSSTRVNSTAKALKILDCFSPTQTELSLAEMSRMMDIPKSTLLNQLRTLEDAGFIICGQTPKTYRLGYKLMTLSSMVQAATPIIKHAIPVMDEIQEATEEIVYLTTHINGQVLFLEGIFPRKRSIGFSIAGKTLPMHCTASGKAMLSHMSPEQVKEIITAHGMPKSGPNTCTDFDKLMEMLATCRDLGYATDFEEETVGVNCVAVAVRNLQGDVAGALSVSGSSISIRPENVEKYAILLSRGSNSLSEYAHMFPAIQLQNAASKE